MMALSTRIITLIIGGGSFTWQPGGLVTGGGVAVPSAGQ
jgi:hypothetical protein